MVTSCPGDLQMGIEVPRIKQVRCSGMFESTFWSLQLEACHYVSIMAGGDHFLQFGFPVPFNIQRLSVTLNSNEARSVHDRHGEASK